MIRPFVQSKSVL